MPDLQKVAVQQKSVKLHSINLTPSSLHYMYLIFFRQLRLMRTTSLAMTYTSSVISLNGKETEEQHQLLHAFAFVVRH